MSHEEFMMAAWIGAGIYILFSLVIFAIWCVFFVATIKIARRNRSKDNDSH